MPIMRGLFSCGVPPSEVRRVSIYGHTYTSTRSFVASTLAPDSYSYSLSNGLAFMLFARRTYSHSHPRNHAPVQRIKNPKTSERSVLGIIVLGTIDMHDVHE